MADGPLKRGEKPSVYDTRRLLAELINTQSAVLLPEAGRSNADARGHMYNRLGNHMPPEESSIVEESVSMKIEGRFSTVAERSCE